MNKTFPIQLQEALHKRLKIAAIEEGVTLHDLIVRTLEESIGFSGQDQKISRQRHNHDHHRQRH